MNQYQQTTGNFENADGVILGKGYAGHGAGLNNPAMQFTIGLGPLPIGHYTIENPRDDPHTGPFSLPLIPDPDNNMGARSAFLIHGDNAEMNHSASCGCIILPRAVREQIWNSGDIDLEVVE